MDGFPLTRMCGKDYDNENLKNKDSTLMWWISFSCSLFILRGRGLWITYLYDYWLDVVRTMLLGKKCVCDIGDVENMDVSCTLILAMENGWKYIILF
jgi:hypothetical protein